MRKMTRKQFYKEYFGLKGLLVYGHKIYTEGTIKYTPERKLLEIKLEHTFRLIQLYSKRKDQTTFFICDRGFVDFSVNAMSEIGEVYIFPGKVDPEEFLSDGSYSSIIRRMYEEYEDELRSRIDQSEKEAVAE